MAVRSVFKSLLLDAPAGSIPAAFRLYDGKEFVPIQCMAASMSETDKSVPRTADRMPRKELAPAAQRALAEAEARRAEYRKREAGMPKEIGGRGGIEPGRYGDWEVKGLAADF
jgi:hypothetical protein